MYAKADANICYNMLKLLMYILDGKTLGKMLKTDKISTMMVSNQKGIENYFSTVSKAQQY
jgi:hypothetical protein